MTFLQTAAAVRAAMGVDEDIPLAEAIRSMSEQMGLSIQDPAGAAYSILYILVADTCWLRHVFSCLVRHYCQASDLKYKWTWLAQH